MNGLDGNKLIQEFLKKRGELLPKIKLWNNFQIENVKLIAGVDLAYWDIDQTTYGTCCIVVIDYDTREVVEKVYSYGEIEIPCLPGFLIFRELPLEKISNEPELYMFDGNGYLHEQHMGMASHASMYLKQPMIGEARSY